MEDVLMIVAYPAGQRHFQVVESMSREEEFRGDGVSEYLCRREER